MFCVRLIKSEPHHPRGDNFYVVAIVAAFALLGKRPRVVTVARKTAAA